MRYREYLLLIFIWAYKDLNGQNQLILSVNSKKIDSIEQIFKKKLCGDSIYYPAGYNKKKINTDLQIIYFLNEISKYDTELERLDSLLRNMKHLHISKQEALNGILNKITFLMTGTYLRAEVNAIFVADKLISRACTLTTLTFGRCTNSQQRIIDFQLVKNFVVKKLEFVTNIQLMSLESDTLIVRNIQSASHQYTDYKFFIPDINNNEDWINKFFYQQYISEVPNYYSYNTADRDFIKLLKNDRIDIIKDMLYSPNYFYAINAMEALMYLGSINKISLTENIKRKMDSLKNANFKITIQKTNDFFFTVNGYKEIKISEKNAIGKYSHGIESSH